MFGQRKICIGGFPGVGSVGKIAADYMSTALNCRTIGSFVSNSFPPQVFVSDGVGKPMQAELKASGENLLILSSDAQPLDIPGMYRLAGEILEAVRSMGVEDFITMAAYVGESADNVMAVATDVDLLKELDAEGIALLKNGAIGGLNGLLVGLSPLYGMRGMCLLGTTSGEQTVDFKAALELLKVASRILQLDISLDSLMLAEENESEEGDALSDDFYISYR